MASVVMEIVAFNADTKADGTGTAGITWISKDIFATHVMNSPDNNTGGWEVSEMRRWLKSDAYNTLPTELKSAITTVNKTYYDKTTNSTLGCSDSVWILHIEKYLELTILKLQAQPILVISQVVIHR